MATVRRGEKRKGKLHESKLTVSLPAIGLNGLSVDDDTVIKFSVADGQEVTVTLSRDEEISFLAALLRGLSLAPQPNCAERTRRIVSNENE